MGDHIQLEVGFPPWRPSDSAQLVTELDRYDIPLAGVLEQHGVRHLFWCLAGQVDDWSVWLYTRLDAEAQSQLAQIRNREDLPRLLTDRDLVLAIAHETHGIQTATLIRKGEDRRPYSEVVQTALQSGSEHFDQARRALEELFAKAV